VSGIFASNSSVLPFCFLHHFEEAQQKKYLPLVTVFPKDEAYIYIHIYITYIKSRREIINRELLKSIEADKIFGFF